MANNMSERATIPFLLSLVGLLVSAVAGLIVGLAGVGMFGAFRYGSMMGGMMGGYNGASGMMNYNSWGMSGWGTYAWAWVPILVASIAIGAVGVFMVDPRVHSNVIAGAVLILISAVLAFPTFFGFVVGSTLMMAGGILSLVWRPNGQNDK